MGEMRVGPNSRDDKDRAGLVCDRRQRIREDTFYLGLRTSFHYS